MEESILVSVKKLLGILDAYTDFDVDIIMHINSTFTILTQLGVGPSEGFMITDKTSTWGEFISDPAELNLVRTYVYQRVRLMFDPPTSSMLLDALKEQIREFEWRMNVAEDKGE